MGKKLNHGVVNFWPHASIKSVFFKNDQSDSYLGHITYIYTYKVEYSSKTFKDISFQIFG